MFILDCILREAVFFLELAFSGNSSSEQLQIPNGGLERTDPPILSWSLLPRQEAQEKAEADTQRSSELAP